ncbi:hypothetical protein DXG01_002403 [Tephrocybe rancida]|nr:hypothetical protein DXG01_002403 [Tephrocybe rancida]
MGFILPHLLTMGLNLPFEIWSRIASFLQPECVKKLYSVNHAMFQIGMEEKYRLALFRSSDDLLRVIPLLIHPIASGHVRSLDLSPHILPHTVFRLDKRENRDGLLAKAFRNRHRKRPPTNSVAPLEQILLVLRGFTNLTSLKLQSHGYHNCRELKSSIRSIAPALSSFKGLRILTLDIMVEGYQSLAPTTVFPVLEILTIALSHAYCSTDSKFIIHNVLAPFINNHHSTLCTFNLSTLHSPYTFDIPAFLLDLRHFSRLRSFSLRHPFVSIRQSDSAGVSHILRLHSEQLLELSLHAKGPIRYSMYPTAEQWYAQEFLQIQLPKLQVLDLDIELYPDIIRTASYLGQFRDSLISLKLAVNTLSYDDVQHIAETFSRQDRLTELRMSIGALSLQIFALLAKKLPALEILFLEFDELDMDSSDESMRGSSMLAERYLSKSPNSNHGVLSDGTVVASTNATFIMRTAIEHPSKAMELHDPTHDQEHKRLPNFAPAGELVGRVWLNKLCYKFGGLAMGA